VIFNSFYFLVINYVFYNQENKRGANMICAGTYLIYLNRFVKIEKFMHAKINILLIEH
jgi:hypothetical protein